MHAPAQPHAFSSPLPPHYRYALFYLLREIGSLRGGMGDFVDHVRAAGSPTAQLKLLNAYRPAELALSGASEEQWDAAVYTTLDRATLLKRLLRDGGGGGGDDGAGFASSTSGASSPAGSAPDAGSSTGAGASISASAPAAAEQTFDGPVVALLPRDRLGTLMLETTRHKLGRPAAAAGDAGVQHVPLDTRHTECLLTEHGRQATAVLLTDAIRAVLQRL